MYILTYPFPWINNILLASKSTPWGVVTSLFIHSGWEHLFSNMIGLFFFCLIFSFSNYYLSSDEKRSRFNFFIFAIFTSTLISNTIWIIIVNLGTVGASGLVYASEGVVTGFCLINSWDIVNEIRNSKVKKDLDVLAVNLFIFIAIVFWMVFYTNSFLSYGRDVNVLIHGTSFIISFILAMQWGNIKNILPKKEARSNP
jgi:membrane associated rhomboid family serine protease